MKYCIRLFYFFLFVTILQGCKKESNTESFYQSVTGIWIPYQITFPDTIQQTNMIGANTFGAYDESILFNEDQTFMPGSMYSGSFLADTLESGTYTYSNDDQKLTLLSHAGWTWKVKHFDNDELWLATYNFEDVIYCFKRLQ